MILVYFPSGGCVDDVVNNQTNHQFSSAIAVHFMNSVFDHQKEIFNLYICLHLSRRYTHNQFERCNEKPRHQRQPFSKILYLKAHSKV